jgi:hypothetical protein
MIAARPDVVALSNSEQHRETLLIMLGPDFDVTALPAPPPTAPAPGAHAVVLSEPWDVDTLMRVRRCWPSAGLVLVDAPESATAALPHASRATWSDPLALPGVVAAAAARMPVAAADEVRLAVDGARLDLRPSLETARVLAALLRVVQRPESVRVASTLLGERLRDLCQRLLWVRAYEAADAEVSTDIGALVESACRERGLETAWNVRGSFSLPCSTDQARALAHCLLRAVLEGATAGPVAIEIRPSVLRLRPAERRGGGNDFPACVARTLTRLLGARWLDDGSTVAVVREEDGDDPLD